MDLLVDPADIIVQTPLDLLNHASEINHTFFTDDKGLKNVKTKLVISGLDFQTANAVNGANTNLVFVQNRNVNILVEQVFETIQRGEVTELNGALVKIVEEE